MKLEIVNSSIVVLAEQHNPTILHPAFLEAQEIVPPDWKTAEPPVCLPPVATVKYTNGIEFTAEPNKLQVFDRNPPEQPGESLLPDRVSLYVEALPHVNYTAVGTNMMAFFCAEKPNDILAERFLKADAFAGVGSQVDGFGLSWRCKVADPVMLSFKSDVGNLKSAGDDEPREGILLSGNYHTQLEEKKFTHAVIAIGRYSEWYNHFVETSVRVFGLER